VSHETPAPPGRTSGQFRILVVDDERAMRESLAAWLDKEGYPVACAAGGDEALELLRAESYDLLLLDVKMPGMDGMQLLQIVQQSQPELLVVMITAYGAIEDAVEAMKLGAHDYLLKPFDPEQLMVLIQRLARSKSLIDENAVLREQLRGQERTTWGDLLAASPAMQRVLDLVQELAASESAVLITGETGTGKEMVARALHASGTRAAGHFVPINCGAQTETLLESELFGHERGAFTGAVKARRGRVEMADGGTLFLDEVGEIPPKMQVDLLRVLEEKSFLRLGGSRTVQSDFRLVSATHRDLGQMVRDGRFRQDFFYRINVMSIHIPPLRERLEDIALLAEHFLLRYARQAGKALDGIAPEALEILASYPWPGNVRELKNVIERAVVIARGPRLSVRELTFLRQGGDGGPELVTLAENERNHIQRTLDAHHGNITRAAAALGIDRRTLSRKIQRHGLKARP
jgi:two-component system response regulator HydG